jgi:hypothetical protein
MGGRERCDFHAAFGNADELLLNDKRADVAEGEAMDRAHGASLYASASVRAASIEPGRRPHRVMTDASAVL